MNNKTRGLSEKDKTLAVLWPDDVWEKVAWDVALACSFRTRLFKGQLVVYSDGLGWGLARVGLQGGYSAPS